jgi:F-type H+-transporting ATPase subunit b
VNINSTLIGQMLTFAIFVWVTMQYVWPALEAALKDRSKKISDGLSAAKEGHEILAKSKESSSVEIQQAKKKANEIIAQANKKVAALMEDAKKDAKLECDNMIKTAKNHIKQEENQARANLQAEIVSLVIKGVEKILSKSINNKDNADIISKIIRKG